MPELETRLERKFTSLVTTTVQALSEKNIRHIGLLASPTTIRTKLYESELNDAHITVSLPSLQEQADIETVIRDVIGGRLSVEKLSPIVRRLQATGASHILLGCTELSVAFKASKDKRLIDPLTIVTEHLITEGKQ